MREVSHGFLMIRGSSRASSGLTMGTIRTEELASFALEIRHGNPVARTALKTQFITRMLFRDNLKALGDNGTFDGAQSGSSKGIPWQASPQWVTAPAMLCADVDVTP